MFISFLGCGSTGYRKNRCGGSDHIQYIPQFSRAENSDCYSFQSGKREREEGRGRGGREEVEGKKGENTSAHTCIHKCTEWTWGEVNKEGARMHGSPMEISACVLT